MNALAAKLSLFSALALAAAGCTDMEPGTESEPELGSSSAALVVGAQTWSARIEVGTFGPSGWRYGSPVGRSAVTTSWERASMFGPLVTARTDRFSAELERPTLTPRTITLYSGTPGNDEILGWVQCTIPARGTSCTTTVSGDVPSNARIFYAITGGSAAELDSDVLISWTFH